MPTLFSTRIVGRYSPLYEHYQGISITPNDSTDIPAGPGGPVGGVCVGLHVANTGNVAGTTTSGVTVTFTAVPANTILDVALRRVLATGTTASGISALFGNPQ